MNELTDFSFLHLSQVSSLWSSKISYGSVNMLPSSLVHRCWYVDSKALLFPSYFFKLHSVHDFSNLTLLFLFIWLNSDSSFRTLHMVYTWSILFYPLRPRQGSNFNRQKKWCKTPQSTSFKYVFITCLPMIFVCANCPSFSPQPTIFNSARITDFYMRRMSWHLNQHFKAEYSRLIFAWLLFV